MNNNYMYKQNEIFYFYSFYHIFSIVSLLYYVTQLSFSSRKYKLSWFLQWRKFLKLAKIKNFELRFRKLRFGVIH